MRRSNKLKAFCGPIIIKCSEQQAQIQTRNSRIHATQAERMEQLIKCLIEKKNSLVVIYCLDLPLLIKLGEGTYFAGFVGTRIIGLRCSTYITYAC